MLRTAATERAISPRSVKTMREARQDMSQPRHGSPERSESGDLLPVIYAALFAALFMAIGWQNINPYGFDDLENYRIGFQSQIYIYHVLDLSPIEFFLNEAAWVWGFDAIYGYLGDIDSTFAVLTASSVFLFSLYVIRRTNSFIYLLFLINPAFVDMVVGQIRSGLAASLFFSAAWIRNKWIKVVFIVLAASLHTSFILLGIFYLGFHILRRMGPYDITVVKPYAAMALLAAAAIVVTIFREGLLASVGDQRAFEVLSIQSRVFLSFGFLTFSISYVLLSRDKSVTFESGFYLLNVIMALISAVIGVYGSRFVAYGIPVLAVMAFHLPAERRVAFFVHYAAFSAIYFVYWLV